VAVLAPASSGVGRPLASAGLRLQAVDDPAAATATVEALLAEIAAAASKGRPDRAALSARP
jgi:hypothetical protein